MAKVDRLIGRSEPKLAVCEYRVTRSKTSNSCPVIYLYCYSGHIMQGGWRSCNNVYTTGVVVDKFDRLSAFNTAALVLCFGMNGGFLRP